MVLHISKLWSDIKSLVFLLNHSVCYLHIIDNQFEAVNGKVCRCPQLMIIQIPIGDTFKAIAELSV